MKNLPIYPTGQKPASYLDQRNRVFSWAQGITLTNSLRNQMFYMDWTAYDVSQTAYIDKSGIGLRMVLNGAALGRIEGPITYGDCPGAAGDYFEDASGLQDDYVKLYNPTIVLWVKNRTTLGATRWWVDKLSAGAGFINWGVGLNAAGQVTFRLSSNGTAITDLQPTNPADLTKWNFFGIQHVNATTTYTIVNDQVTTHATGFVYNTVKNGALRIGWGANALIALVGLATNDAANGRTTLLDIFYHSRYAFRDDWT